MPVCFESLTQLTHAESLVCAGTSSGDDLELIRVKFVCECHRVKVKFTAAKKNEIPYSRDVELLSAITLVL